MTVAPPSVSSNLKAWATEIDQLLSPLAVGHLRDINEDSEGLRWITGTPYYWSPLPAEAHADQARVLEEYRRFSSTLQVLLRQVPADRLERLKEDTELVLGFINRDRSAYRVPERVLEAAREALQRQIELADGLYSSSTSTILIPDTNALYWNSALEDWRLPWDTDTFIVALTPTVLKEIDLHKADDRRNSRREKAERFARQIGEYRRRGPLLKGVTLVKGISSVLAIAAEPRMVESLPWLDATNADDRLVASVIEVMRQNPRAAVVVVTRDINFQNKLEFARVPFVDPELVVASSDHN